MARTLRLFVLRLARWLAVVSMTVDAVVAGVPGLTAAAQQQVIVIDVPGIESDGAGRPAEWGPVLTGSSSFARYNLRHEGALGFNSQGREAGVTATLPQLWNERRDATALAPLLADVEAGRNVYVKIDQNMKLGSYATGKPLEDRWPTSRRWPHASRARASSSSSRIATSRTVWRAS